MTGSGVGIVSAGSGAGWTATGGGSGAAGSGADSPRKSSSAPMPTAFSVSMTTSTGSQILFLGCTGTARGAEPSVGVACSRRSFSLLRNASRMNDIVASLPDSDEGHPPNSDPY